MKKSSKLFSAILAVLLMVSALGTVPANAAEAEVTVNSLPELQEAIAAAVDGDTIHIAGDIEIQEEVSIGTVDKTVFLAGAEGTSVVLSISPDFPDGQSVSFTNLVFCGGQSSGLSFVQSGGTSYFQTVRFQHPNESSGKSACLGQDHSSHAETHTRDRSNGGMKFIHQGLNLLLDFSNLSV